MLSSFVARHYRNVTTGPIAFGSINLLIGPNNAGKSNLMGAIGLLPRMLEAPKNGRSGFHAMLGQEGWTDLLDRRLEPPGSVELEWQFRSGREGRPLSYTLGFQVGTPEQIPAGFFIERERLDFGEATSERRESRPFYDGHGRQAGEGLFSRPDRSTAKARAIALSATEIVFRQVEILLEDPGFRVKQYPFFSSLFREVEDYWRGFSSYTSTAFDLGKMSAPAAVDLTARTLEIDAANFVNVFKNLSDDTRFDFSSAYLTHVRELVPELEEIRTLPAGERLNQVRVKMGGRWFGLRELSDGTRKAMLLALLLWTPERYSILSIDEPELNLHPAWLRVVGGWLQRFTSSEQLFVSTHSPDLLDSFTDGFRRGDVGVFVFNPGHDPGIERLEPRTLEPQFDAGWQLGDMYRVGEPRIGGWPW